MLFGGRGGGAKTSRGRRRATFAETGRDVETEMEVSLEDAFAGAKKTFMLGNRRMEVTIPKGVKDGQKLRLARQGEEGPDGRGDLLIRIKVRNHPVYERKDDDLYVDVPVDYLTAILGGEVTVPTLGGRVKMKIPPGTSSGRVFRLPGQGMPVTNKKERGNLYARVRIQVPETLGDHERRLLEELKNLES